MGERLYLSRIFAIFLGTFGILLVLGIGFYDFSILSIIPLTAGAFYALASLTLRQWCRNESAISVMFMFFLGMGLFAAILVTLIEANSIFEIYLASETFLNSTLRIPSQETVSIILFHAASSILGGILITVGYQRGETSFVSVFEYSFLFFATLWAYIVFGELISSTILVGMVLIILSGFFISFSEKK